MIGNEILRLIFIFDLESKKPDSNRLKQLNESVLDKGANVFRAHNEYIIKLREYNFADELYVSKIKNLLIYHEESQYILNKTWLVK